ncbi:MAG: extracellular solute-binding protein [Candidatus Limnocylindrales bacterium]
MNDQMEAVVQIATEYQAGTISRRAFIVRLFALGLSLTSVSAILAACSSSTQTSLATGTAAGSAPTLPGSLPASAVPSASPLAGKITIWDAFSDDAHAKYFQPHWIDPFVARDRAESVQLVVKPFDSFNQVLQTALVAGSGPDIIVAGIPQLVGWAGAGYLADLTKYAQIYGWADQFQPWALSVGKLGGKLVFLPNELETMIALYSPDTFKKYGWSMPTNRAEFEALCTDAASRGIMPVGAGNADFQPASEWLVGIFLNYAAGPQAVYEGLTGVRPWSDAVFVGALSLLIDYMHRGWIGGGVQKYFTNSFATLYGDLAKGTAAMMLPGSWSFAEVPAYFGAAANNTATWDWAPLWPFASGVPEDLYMLAVGSEWAANAASNSLDVAGDWLNYRLTSAQRQAQALKDEGDEPAPLKFTASDFVAGTDQRYQRLYVTLGAAKNIGYTTWTFWGGPSDTYLYTTIDKVFAGKMSVEDYLSGLDVQFKKDVAAGIVPPIPAPSA